MSDIEEKIEEDIIEDNNEITYTEPESTSDISEDDHYVDEKTEEKVSYKKVAVEILIYLLLLVICVVVIPRYVVQRTKVSGPSMLETLHNGDNLIVEKISYRFTNPDRFDIIVFYPYGREDKDDYYVKRVIGLPGETIQIIKDKIYINGEVLEENYGKDPITDQGIAKSPITLGEDEFFVLGDNREVSEDSRYFGPVEKENISGHVIFRIYPFSSFGPL